MLIVSEIAEAMEGHRKGLMDDKLPHRLMIEVELADAMLRSADLAGALGLNLGAALAEKMAFNATREDHKIATRKLAEKPTRSLIMKVVRVDNYAVSTFPTS